MIIAAFAGTGDLSGIVSFFPLTLNTGGSGSNVNGNILLLVGATTATSYFGTSLNSGGDINTTSGTGGGGNITIATATPSVGSGITVNNGTISSGSVTAGTTQTTSMIVNTLESPGGAISLTAGVDSKSGVITDTGLGSNNGGSITIVTNSSTAFNIGSASTNGTTGTITANGGPTAGGGGGTISITNSGSGGIALFDYADISFAPGAGGGAGGNLTFNATGGTVTLPTGTISASASGSGNYNGGSISLTGTALSVNGSAPATLALTANATGTGNGGSLYLMTTGVGGLTLGSADQNISSLSATGGSSGSASGNGGSITLIASGGALTVPNSFTFSVNALGTNGNGGIISLSGSTVSFTGGSESLTANGVGTGNGGSISITTSGSTGDIVLGSSSGSISSISATGGSAGSASGNGGTVTLSAGRNLTIPSTGGIINVNAIGTNGTGGSIILAAGTVTSSGTLQINQGLGANGVGTGNGGTVSITYSDSTGSNPLVIGAGSGSNNFINGNISANASGSGNGGIINIANSGAALLSVTLTGNISASGSTLGNINFNPASGQAISVAGAGALTGVVNATGTSVYINPQASATTLTTGTISATAGAGSVMLGVNGLGSTINITGAITSSGAPLSILSSQDITTTTGATINTSGGAITLVSGSAFTTTQSTSTFSVTGSTSSGGQLNLFNLSSFSSATSSGNTNGGNITLAAFAGSGSNSGSISSPVSLTITSGGHGSGTNGSFLALAGAPSDNAPYSQFVTMHFNNINTSGGTGGGGNITLATATPSVGSGLTITNGAITSGSIVGNGTPSNPGALYLDSATTSGGNVAVISGFSITSDSGNAITTNGGAITLIAGAAFSTPTGSNVLNITGASSTGGPIYAEGAESTFGLSSSTSAGNTNGGNVTVIAFGSSLGLILTAGGTSAPISAGGFGSGTNGNVIVVAGGSSNNGGIYLTDINTTGGTGAGGNITIASATPSIGSGISINNGTISAGTVSAGAAQTGQINIGTVEAPGSTIAVSASATVGFSGAITDNGLGANNGGTVNITANTSSAFSINGYSQGTPSGTGGAISVNGGPTAGGGGGTISITNSGSGGITLFDYADISFAPGAGGGAGGSLTFNATGGTVTLPTGTISASASGSGNYNGGTINLTGSTVSVTGSGTLSLTANATGTGNGGSVLITTTASSGSIVLGAANGDIASIQAEGGSSGSASGNGGTVTLAAGNNLTIPSTSNIINVNPQGTNGKGGIINLTAGSAAAGSLQVNQALSANGAGTGNGGTISVTYNDPTNPLVIGASGSNSYINGNISANAPGSGNGGSISITNSAAGALTVTLSGTISASGTSTGSVTFNSVSGQAIAVTGTGGLTGIVNNNSSAGAVTYTVGTGNLTLGNISNSSGNIIITNNAVSGTISTMAAITTAAGSTLSMMTTGGSITLAGAINTGAGGTINLTANGSSSTIGNSSSYTLTADTMSLSQGSGNIVISGNNTVQMGGSGSNNLILSGLGTSLTLSTAGNITDANTSNSLSAPRLSLSSISGSIGSSGTPISINNNGNGITSLYASAPSGTVHLTDTASENVTLTTAATTGASIAGTSFTLSIAGNILQDTAGSTAISSPIISLTATNGNIADNAGATSPLIVNSDGTGGVTLALSGNNVNISDTTAEAVTLNASNIATSFTLAANGNVTVGNNVGSGTCTLASITTTGSNFIEDAGPGSYQLTASTIDLITPTGQVGTPGFRVDCTTLAVNTTGNVRVNNTGTATLAVNASSGNNLTIVSNSTMDINGNVTGNSVTLQTSAGSNGSIVIASNVGTYAGNTTVSLFTDGSGNIQDAGPGSNVVQAHLLNIASTTGNVGSPGLRTIADEINCTTGGNVHLNNIGSNPVTFLAITGGGTFFQALANSTITVTQPIFAPGQMLLSVVSGNGNIIINAAVGTTTSTTSVSVEGSGSITTGVGGTIYGSTVIVNDPYGNIGSMSTPISIAGNHVQLQAINGLVNASNSIGGAVTLGNVPSNVTGAGTSFNFNTTGTGPLTVYNVTAANGNLTIVNNVGGMTIASGSTISASNGNITLQDLDTSNGSITIGGTVTINATASTAGLGNVYAVIGSIPGSPVIGTTPSNVVVNDTGGGQTYFGTNSIIASAPTNTLNATGANIVFNTGNLPASAISLGGSVTITADPPVANVSTAIGEIATNSVGNITYAMNMIASPVNAQSNTLSMLQTPSSPIVSIVPTSRLLVLSPLLSLTSKYFQGLSSLTATDREQLFSYTNLNSSLNSRIDEEHNKEEAENIEQENLIPGTTISAFHFGMNEVRRLAKDGVLISNNSGNNGMELKQGNVLLTPDRDFTVNTEIGKIIIGAGTTAFIMKNGDDMLVYNVIQTKPKQVTVTVYKQKLMIDAGNMLRLTKQQVDNDDKMRTNTPIIAYGNVQTVNLNGEVKAYTANFSIMSALANVQPLKRLSLSTFREDQKMLERALKCAQIQNKVVIADETTQNTGIQTGVQR